MFRRAELWPWKDCVNRQPADRNESGSFRARWLLALTGLAAVFGTLLLQNVGAAWSDRPLLHAVGGVFTR